MSGLAHPARQQPSPARKWFSPPLQCWTWAPAADLLLWQICWETRQEGALRSCHVAHPPEVPRALAHVANQSSTAKTHSQRGLQFFTRLQIKPKEKRKSDQKGITARKKQTHPCLGSFYLKLCKRLMLALFRNTCFSDNCRRL